MHTTDKCNGDSGEAERYHYYYSYYYYCSGLQSYITCNNNNITYSRLYVCSVDSVVRLIMTSKVAIERSRLLLLLY